MKRLLRPLKAWLGLALQGAMPRFDALERSTADLWQAVREVEAAVGRLAKQHEGTWGQVQDIDARATHDRTEIAALRDETGDLTRGWLQLRTSLRRLEQRDCSAANLRMPQGRTLYISRNGSTRGGTVAVRPEENEAVVSVGNLAALPFAPGSFDAIVVSGPDAGAEPSLLEYWHALLRSGGTLTFVKAAK